jgi:hypothetical protein
MNRHQRRSAKHNKGPEYRSPLLNLALMRGTLVKDIILQGTYSDYFRTIPMLDVRPMAELKRIRKATRLKNDPTIAH